MHQRFKNKNKNNFEKRFQISQSIFKTEEITNKKIQVQPVSKKIQVQPVSKKIEVQPVSKKTSMIPQLKDTDIKDKIGYFSKQFFNETGVLDEFLSENETKILINACISKNDKIEDMLQFKRYNDWVYRGKLVKYIRSIG
jgi:hypothetical protein